MKTVALDGPVESPEPMNPTSHLFSNASVDTAREISAFFGRTRAQLSKANDHRARVIVLRGIRREAHWLVILSLLAEVRALRNYLKTWHALATDGDTVREMEAALYEANVDLTRAIDELDELLP